MLLNNSYIGGILEKIGGFYLHRNKYIYFKFILSNKYLIILPYLQNKLGIKTKYWKNICYVTDNDSINNLIEFMKKNCLRDDYKEMEIRLKQKTNQNI